MATNKIQLNSSELMDHILFALDNKSPLSVISIGATESYAMAQYGVLSKKEFMNTAEAIKTNKNYLRKRNRGFTFPNKELRNQMIKATKQANIVGYCISIPTMDAGLMTERVFKAYNIKPKFVYDSLIRRVIIFSQEQKFMEMLKNKKVLLVGSLSKEVKTALTTYYSPQKLNFKIVDTIPIHSFNQIPSVKKKIDKSNFDLCLLAAGVNSVILAPYIASVHGKVAFDLGQGMNSIITRTVTESSFVKEVGLDNIMKM